MRQWHLDGLADHSCGSSTGFTPVSLLGPDSGTDRDKGPQRRGRVNRIARGVNAASRRCLRGKALSDIEEHRLAWTLQKNLEMVCARRPLLRNQRCDAIAVLDSRQD